MKRTLIAAAVAGALSLGTLALYAQGPHGHGGGHGGWGNPLEHLTNELNLTADQQAKIAPIVDTAKPQIQAIHEEAMQKTRAVMENAAAQIRPLLTPEQQQKFDAVRKAHEDMLNAMRELHQAKSR